MHKPTIVERHEDGTVTGYRDGALFRGTPTTVKSSDREVTIETEDLPDGDLRVHKTDTVNGVVYAQSMLTRNAFLADVAHAVVRAKQQERDPETGELLYPTPEKAEAAARAFAEERWALEMSGSHDDVGKWIDTYTWERI